jgi:hypothetical protein
MHADDVKEMLKNEEEAVLFHKNMPKKEEQQKNNIEEHPEPLI